MTTYNRRDFISSVAVGAALTAASTGTAGASSSSGPVFINTWSDSFSCVTTAAHEYAKHGDLMTAVEKAINTIEDDPAIQSVGYGGLPNAEGIVELDAAIMNGTNRRAGSICNLRDVKNPISVARLLMERTHHTTMAGLGAREFAIEMGFEPTQLLTPQSLEAWQKWRDDPNRKTYWLDGKQPAPCNHDTVGLLGCDGKGHVVSGCSTSGIAFKLPGRVADSPLVGCGVYADDSYGAASATGDGDIMTNYCTSFHIVMLMGQGKHPQEACEEVMTRMLHGDPRAAAAQAAVIAIDNKGNVGAAQMRSDSHFQYGVWRDGKATLTNAKAIL